jgi:hypothetical protein
MRPLRPDGGFRLENLPAVPFNYMPGGCWISSKRSVEIETAN